MNDDELPEPIPEPDDDAAALATITPLSFFFPSITPTEARHLDGESFRISERRTKVMVLFNRGLSMHRIAEEVGCSSGTVHKDVHDMMEGFKLIAARSIKEHIANALQKLAWREAQIEEDLERSRGEYQETSTSRRSTTSGTHDQAVVKKRSKYGDPKLHALLLGCWDRRCKLLALLMPSEHGQGGLPPVKIIAGGIDPAELV